MRLAVVQMDIKWEQPDLNKMLMLQYLAEVSGKTDIAIFPEMCWTGFSMRPELCADSSQQAYQLLQSWSNTYKVVIACSLMVSENGSFYNRFFWVQPDGKVMHYDKRHLFSIGNEAAHYTAGSSRVVIPYLGWQIFPAICYDLRFPVWLRRTREHEYQLMLIVANWPDKRLQHWRQLLIARAIENQCIVVACNRFGTDGNGITHTGASGIISETGELLHELTGAEGIIYHEISQQNVTTWRSQFPAINDADAFELLI